VLIARKPPETLTTRLKQSVHRWAVHHFR